jgi:class 3 adenylate cyclase/tetratricopeptide (TPR) repeat protein
VEATARVEDAIIAARSEGRGRVLLLSGEAGVGKTRVTAEVGTRARALGMSVLTGGCSETSLAVPYLPFVEALGNHVAATGQAALEADLGQSCRDLARLFPQLGQAEQRPQDDPAHARLRLFEAMVQLATHAARPHGLLLVVEDLHWSDDSVRELFEYYCRRLHNLPVALVATYRSDALHRQHPLAALVKTLTRGRLADAIQLDPMAREHIDEMLDAIFGHGALTPELREALFDRCEGNPFVLEEMLKEALDRGDIFRRGHEWSDSGARRLSIPETVAETILDRLDELEPKAARVLSCAAVLGRSFDPDVVARVAGSDVQEVIGALGLGAAGQLLEWDPAGGWSFRHALTREAIYHHVNAAERQRLHGLAADALAESAAPAGAVAHHLLEAGRWGDAVPLCIEAAAEALARGGPAEAVGLYQKVLPLVTDRQERGRVLCRLGEATWGTGDAASAERYLADGLSLLDSREPGAPSWRLLLGRVQFERGMRAEAHETYATAVTALEEEGPSVELSRAYTWQSSLELYRFNIAAAEERANLALGCAERTGDAEAMALALTQRGWTQVVAGRVADGLKDIDLAIERAESAHPRVLGQALYIAALSRESSRDLSRSAALIDRLDAVAGDPVNHLRAGVVRGGLATLNGRLSDAREILSDGAAVASSMGMITFQSWFEADLAGVRAEMGDMRAAASVLPRLGDDDGEWSRWERFGVVQDGFAHGSLDLAARASIVAEMQVVEVPWPLWRAVASAAEWLVGEGRLSDASGVLAALDSQPEWLTGPHRVVALARVAVAGGVVPDLDALGAAGKQLEQAGFVLDHWRSSIVLASALILADRRDDAEAVITRVVDGTRRNGAQAVLDEALSLAARHNIRLPEAVTAAAELSPPLASGGGRHLGSPTERLVTVMFADVRGYTGMTRTVAPPVMAEKMRAFYRWARTAVESRGGVVDEFRGDSVMATFNLSGSRLDHCGEALAAALALREKAALADLHVGVGVAVGSAVVGSMTDDGRLTVIGPAANLAARLQAQAGPGEILIDEEAHRRAGADLRAAGHEVSFGRRSLKGFDEDVAVWTIHPSTNQQTATAAANKETK